PVAGRLWAGRIPQRRLGRRGGARRARATHWRRRPGPRALRCPDPEHPRTLRHPGRVARHGPRREARPGPRLRAGPRGGGAGAGGGGGVQPHTRFMLASVPKAITAVTVLKLVQEGRLALDATVLPFLAAAESPVDPRWQMITVEMLLRHEGGWNRRTSGDP